MLAESVVTYFQFSQYAFLSQEGTEPRRPSGFLCSSDFIKIYAAFLKYFHLDILKYCPANTRIAM
jgi:hypothetical protein